MKKNHRLNSKEVHKETSAIADRSGLVKAVLFTTATLGILTPLVLGVVKATKNEVSQILKSRQSVEAAYNPIQKPAEEHVPQTYVVLANGSGVSNPSWYSLSRDQQSIEGLVSFYDLMRSGGVPKKNIDFLLYNPSQITIPGNNLEEEVTGVSTKGSFLKTVKKRASEMQKGDLLYVVISDASPIADLPRWENSTFLNQGSLNFFANSAYGSGKVFPQELSEALAAHTGKDEGEVVIIQQGYEEGDVLTTMGYRNPLYGSTAPERTVIIDSPNTNTDYNSEFIGKIVDTYKKNHSQSLAEVFEKVSSETPKYSPKPYAGYFNAGGKLVQPYASPAFRKPLLPVKKK